MGVIHGKYAHEETIATKSMAETYICVKNEEEANIVADFILNAEEGDGKAEKFLARFSKAASSHFDPHKHLQKIGLANQTTMDKDPNQPDLDFILVVGGFDSSNTAHLLEIPQ